MKTALLLLAFAALSPLSGAVLELRDQQTVATDNLTLNDVLKSSQGLRDEDLAAIVASSPSLGKSATLTREQIEASLPSSLKGATLEWTGAAAIVINRPAVSFAPADVKRLLTAELARHLSADADFAILEVPDANAFLVPDGQVEAQVEITPGSFRNEWGQATIKFRSQGQLAVTTNLRFHWACTKKVWQVQSRVNDHDALTAASFQPVEVNVLKLPGATEPAGDFPDGKVAAHTLPEGKILMENDWVEPVLVNRNYLVTILYQKHGISITVQARAMAKGVKGDVISVQNVTSHKVFNARVVDQRSLVYEE